MLSCFSTKLQSQLKIEIKRNLKKTVFSYLHHQHPTYTREQFDKGIKRWRRWREISLPLHLRHQHTRVSECCTRTRDIERHGSVQEKVFCTSGQTQMDRLVANQISSYSRCSTLECTRILLKQNAGNKQINKQKIIIFLKYIFLTDEEKVHRELFKGC